MSSKVKYYTKWGVGTDSQGKKHYVTVVGKMTRDKVKVSLPEETFVVDENGKRRDAVLVVDYPQTVKNFTMARAICDPQDEFDEEYGVKLATRRIEEDKVIGTLSSSYVTMLNDDQCRGLVETEVEHICKNIDTYIG